MIFYETYKLFSHVFIFAALLYSSIKPSKADSSNRTTTTSNVLSHSTEPLAHFVHFLSSKPQTLHQSPAHYHTDQDVGPTIASSDKATSGSSQVTNNESDSQSVQESHMSLQSPTPPLSSQVSFRWPLDFAPESATNEDEFRIETTDARASDSQIAGRKEKDSDLQSHGLESVTSSSVINSSSVHPLLIYSIRYEIRSLDLSNSTSVIRTTLPPASQVSVNTNSAPAAFYEPQTTFSGRNYRTLIAGLKNTIGLDFFYSEQESFIFWTDVVEERIYRGTINNGTITNVEMLVQSGLATAEGLAVDWIGKNIYWVESTLDHIEVAKMNGTSRKTLIAGEMESPRAIAVDPRYGLLFWSDWDKRSPRIERATMSGDDRRIIVHIKEVNGGWPNGLTLDYEQLKIYWIDANSDSIHSVDYEGNRHVELLKSIKSLGHPFSITLFKNNLYWTDWKTNSVSMANKYTGSDAKELQRLPSRLFDIKVFHPSRQPKLDERLNPCRQDNGGCSHLCLLTLNHTRKCDCPHLMKLAQDDRTCEADEFALLIGRNNEIRIVDMQKPLIHIMAPINVPKVFSPRQFEYDNKTRSIFWVDDHTNEVKRTHLGGNTIETVIDVIIDNPTGLALDWISGNLYVTSSFMPAQKLPGKIFIANLEGEFISILMDGSQGVISPKSIAVHPVLGLIFCIDENIQSEPIIFSASMDGRHKRIITSKSNNPRIGNPSSLTIDYELNRVYWVNQAGNATIQYYDISEDRLYTFLDETNTPADERLSPTAMCIDGDSLIIASRNHNEAIIKMSKYDPTQRTILRTHIMDQISALKVYNASSQVGSNSCAVRNGNCSQLCVPTNSTNRVCKCTISYTINPLNETECVGKDKFLIYSYNLGMKGIGLDASSSQDEYYLPPIHKAFRASSIDYVYRDNLIYWVDNDEGSITRINRDTTNYQIIVQGLESEESICVDWVAGNIYWLDPYYDIIEVARLNGSNRYVIVSGDMDKANGIVVNPISGYIAWSDVGANPKIETAKLDGSGRKMIVNFSEPHVDDLAIDYVGDHIYWLDSAQGIVERIKPDGTNRKVIYRVAPPLAAPSKAASIHLVSIALHQNYLYIAHDSAHYQGSILRCNKDDGTGRTNVHQNLGDAIRDIAIYAEQPMPPVSSNPCSFNNGGCQDLCLFMGESIGRRCLCSHGRLGQDGTTCQPYDTFIMFAKLSQIDSLHIIDGESPFNSPYQPIVAENRSNIISLTVDHNAGRLIYSELTRDQICSVFFNGSDHRILVERQSLVEGIAFANNQLYWTSIQDNSITRYNTTSFGSPVSNCSESGCKEPSLEKIVRLSQDDKLRGIAIDHCTSTIYWTNWNQHNPSIQRAGPHNGFKVESIIKDVNIKVPNGIAIDHDLRLLYWCDARLDKIERAQLDGSNRIVLMEVAPQHPFALAVWQNHIYWTDWLAKGVFKADKHLGSNPIQIKKVAQRPMGLAIAAPDSLVCPAVDCSVNNGGCAENTKCTYHFSPENPQISSTCVPINVHPHNHTQIETKKPKCHRTDGPCDHTYHDIIMDKYFLNSDRYNITNLEPLNVRLSMSESSSTQGSKPDLTTQVSSLASGITTQSNDAIFNENVAINKTSTPNINTSVTPISIAVATSKTSAKTKDSKATTPMHQQPYPPVESTLPPSTEPSPPRVYTFPPEKATTKDLEEISNIQPMKTVNTTITLPTQASLINETVSHLPCPKSILKTTNFADSNGCNLPGQMACYLSGRLVCISLDKRCDGADDCSGKEGENDGFLRFKGDHNLKRETNWHRFGLVLLIILAAAVAAMVLVFGTRGRRRWFISNGAFDHSRMFDENGTNIEISNPMFDEDDSANLNSCTFSIDLNERTTNFSNPLYERQVLLMNDKHVTPN